MHHAAATPKARFKGTATPAAISVSLIADSASGSVMAAKYTPAPFLKASTKTVASGTKRNSERKASATPISSHLTQVGSVVASGRLRGATAARELTEAALSSAGMALISPRLPCARPRLQGVDRQQQEERRHEHHHR